MIFKIVGNVRGVTVIKDYQPPNHQVSGTTQMVDDETGVQWLVIKD